MRRGRSRVSPGAIRWLALAVASWALAGVAPDGQAQSSRFGRTVPDVRPIDQEEAAKRLAEMQGLRPVGLSSVLFSIEHHPRRQPTRRFSGQLWLAGEAGSVAARVRWQEADGGPVSDCLLHIGGAPAVWWWEEAESRAVPATDRLFQPVMAGSDLLFFDLLNPWFFWEGLSYLGSKRASGSPLHLFEAQPPEHYREGLESLGVASLLIGMDARFNAPVRVEYLDAAGEVVRFLEVRRVKRVGEQWIVRTVEVVDSQSRSRTQFQIREAALNLPAPARPNLFSPENLGQSPDFPPATAFEQL